MKSLYSYALFACIIVSQDVEGFLPHRMLPSSSQQQVNQRQQIPKHQQQQQAKDPWALWASVERPRRKSRNGDRKPSKVTDPDGPTPDVTNEEPEEIGIEDIPELQEIQDESQMPPGPIPHQPWRRGVTAGCEDPISAPWRQEAEELLTKAVSMVGGKVLDVTWYLTALVVTLDEDLEAAEDMLKSSGPVIDVYDKADPLYYDPNDPNPEEIWADEDDIVYQRETEEETISRLEKKRNMYASKDLDDPPEETHIPDDEGEEIPYYMNEETREDAALTLAEEQIELYDEMEKPVDLDTLKIDKAALSTIAQAILDSLEQIEEKSQILARHELILTSPGPPDVLETQRQFDAYRGADVIVETQDPWNSNRVLKGKLLERNSMDVIINKKGRMVTIPNNFVRCVRLPLGMLNLDDDEDQVLEENEVDEEPYEDGDNV